MKEYNYLDIIKFDNEGILFSDNMFINFEECKSEWARENNIPVEKTVCVATRYSIGVGRYFVFYSREKVKLFFKFKGIMKRKKSVDKFEKVQELLNFYGYSSYDET